MTSSRIPPLGGVTEADAVAWVKAMFAAGVFLPLDDDAADIVQPDTGAPLFTPDEAATLNGIIERLHEALGEQFDQIAWDHWGAPSMREMAGDAWEGDLPAGMPEDELRRHRHDRLLGKLQASGWKPDQESLDSNPVRLWLYSVGLDHGPRLVMQAGAQLYRDMQSGGGVIGELAKLDSIPGDNLACAINAYDDMPAPSVGDRQFLGMYLAQYACSSRTWQQRPPLDRAGGVHFVVFDWVARNGKTVLKPACCSGQNPVPMTEEELIGFFRYALDAHLKANPHDVPAGVQA